MSAPQEPQPTHQRSLKMRDESSSDPSRIHDIIGIGIGPFNLGMACLTEPCDDIDAIFLDARESFAWHHGMMLDDATIQVPFLADLVSMADPTSRFSFLNWLKHTGRLYPFYIREDFHPLRSEYDAYCRWAAEQLETLRWGRQVESVEYEASTDSFVVTAVTADGVEVLRGRHIVLGIGTSPYVPDDIAEDVAASPQALHSAEYRFHREEITASESVTVIGSGQSAAEIFADLLDEHRGQGPRLDWVTRSPRFFPMEDTRLTLEMTSPEYTDHFHRLPENLRQELSREQRGLYKGISTDTIDRIYDSLYRYSAHAELNVGMLTDTEITSVAWDEANNSHTLGLYHRQTGESSTYASDHIVVATGYAPTRPAFLQPVEHLIARDSRGRFAVARDYRIDTLDDGYQEPEKQPTEAQSTQTESPRPLTDQEQATPGQPGGRIFVQNAEEHTHGLTAPDLGMGAWRNAAILASILGEEIYPIERHIAFQTFGLPTTSEVKK